MIKSKLTRSDIPVPNMLMWGWAKIGSTLRYSTLDVGIRAAAPSLYRNDCCEISSSWFDLFAHFDSAKRSRKLFPWFDVACKVDGVAEGKVAADALRIESETRLLV